MAESRQCRCQFARRKPDGQQGQSTPQLLKLGSYLDRQQLELRQSGGPASPCYDIIVKRHVGKLGVSSVEGQGRVFASDCQDRRMGGYGGHKAMPSLPS